MLYTIGKINPKTYQCVTKDIMTAEVIITETQIRHIKERHPNDYERFSDYLKEIVESPDYIIETNKPNTALVLKVIAQANEIFEMVVRLITSSDDSSYKNSIITFMKIDTNERDRLLRNKNILYKRD